MSMSTYIYVAHKRKNSNALYAPVRSEHKRFQMLSEFVSANTRIAQVVWQRIQHRRTSLLLLFFLLLSICRHRLSVSWSYIVKCVRVYTALYGTLFGSESEAAFSNYRLWESLGFVVAFAYSFYLCAAVKLYILTSLLVVAMLGYFSAEYLHWKSRRSTTDEDVASNVATASSTYVTVCCVFHCCLVLICEFWIYSLDRITVSQAGTPRHDNCVRLPMSWKPINNIYWLRTNS